MTRRVLRGWPLLAVALALGAPAQDFPIAAPSAQPGKPPPAPQPAAAVDPAAAPLPLDTAVGPLQVLDRFVLPGTRVQIDWQAGQGEAGSDATSPVVVTHGTRPGPVVCLIGGIHGDEINGVEIVRRMAYALDPQQIAGSVIAVPVVNVFGYRAGSRYLPDRRDLNRFFPGTAYGSIASRIAVAFFQGVVRHCSVLVDFHTGSFDRNNLPQVRADLTVPEVLALTRGFGATVVLHSPGTKGMLRTAATAAGIPAATFEVGAPARLQPAEIDAAVQAVDRLLHMQGVTGVATGAVSAQTAPPLPAVEPQPIFYDSRWVRVDSGGLLISEVQLGQRVTRGQRLGRVVDPLRNSERDIVSPLFGRLIGMSQNQRVLPGFAVYHLGEETSAQDAVQEATAGKAPAPLDEDAGGAPAREADVAEDDPEDVE